MIQDWKISSRYFSQLLKSLIILTVLMQLGTFQACISNYKKTQLKELDSLQSFINQTGEIASVDDAMIAQRNDSLKMKLSLIKAKYKGLFPEQLASDMTILSGISSNYERFLKEYPAEVYDNDENAKRLQKLREDFLSNKMAVDAFEKRYPEEKKLLQSNLKAIKETVNRVLPVDNEYHRCSRSVNQAYLELK